MDCAEEYGRSILTSCARSNGRGREARGHCPKDERREEAGGDVLLDNHGALSAFRSPGELLKTHTHLMWVDGEREGREREERLK